MTVIDQRVAGAVLAGQFVDYYDARLFVPKGHFDEAHLMNGGRPEQHVLTTFERFVQPGDIVLDIGANIGTHTFALASLVGKHGKVYSVEADIDNASYLRLSIAESGAQNIFLMAVGAGEACGLIRAACTVGTNSRFSAGGEATIVKIACAVPLDELMTDPISLIKIDIEGAELLALKGLSATIARSRPVVLSEFSPAYISQALGSDRSREFFNFFKERGYDCFHVDFFEKMSHRQTYEDLIAGYDEGRQTYGWGHIDTVFIPSERAVAERQAATNAGPRSYSIPAFLLHKPESPKVPWRFEEPSLTSPVCQLCTGEQMASPDFERLCATLGLPSTFKHRKVWEFTYILAALQRRGVLKPKMRGLGFGTGREPLASAFAAAGADILATDAPDGLAFGLDWSESKQWSARLDDIWIPELISQDKFMKRVQFRPVDMNAIPADLQNFDFCWSACCLEHLGSIRHGLDFVLNSLETLKPGGVAVHTTEFNLQSNDDTLELPALCLLRKRDLEQMALDLVDLGHDVEPLNFWPGATPVDAHVDLPPFSDVHLKLLVGNYVTTSVGLIVTKRA